MKFTAGNDQDICITTFSPVLLQQVHSATIINIDKDTTRTGDGLLSDNPKSVLGIKIADCLPVYLYNNKTMCIIHCGWRGIVAGIVHRARSLMDDTYSYVLGACIGPECYEVKQDVANQFGDRYVSAIKNYYGRYFIDLKKAVIQDLGKKSLIASLDFCTKCHPEYFFSYRRGDRKKRNYAIIARE